MWAEVKAVFEEKEYENLEEMREDVQECLEMESEIPPVHQEWRILSITAEDKSHAIKMAEEYFHKENVIIPYKVCTNKTKIDLLKRKQEIQDTMDKFRVDKAVKNRTSKFIGCKTCGSSMAREHFGETEHTCRMCGNDLWSDTNLKTYGRYLDSIIKIESKLEKCRDTYEVYYYVQASLKTK